MVNIDHLCDLDVEIFNQYKQAIREFTHLKRAMHVVYENQRTLQAHDELNKGNMEAFGQLMNASHISLRDDFEVTGRELDTLVEIAQSYEGVIGSRMTGAGFGGCTVSLIHKDKVSDFIENINWTYKERIGYDADFYVVEAGIGACELFE